mmetsp:Transcript_1489/g.2139  ORF Transcript_1489/g.2139 Transcript_1489/m.2139 type:complete len:200 (-) Transcript_1489:2-601(-)
MTTGSVSSRLTSSSDLSGPNTLGVACPRRTASTARFILVSSFGDFGIKRRPYTRSPAVAPCLRVSNATGFPTHRFLSHSRAGNAPGSSILPFALDAILGAVTRSNVKMTTGAFCPGAKGRPVNTTVSPLKTDLTVATPRLGSTGRIGAAGTGTGRDMIINVQLQRYCQLMDLCRRRSVIDFVVKMAASGMGGRWERASV